MTYIKLSLFIHTTKKKKNLQDTLSWFYMQKNCFNFIPYWEFPDGPVVRTQHYNGLYSIPGQETKILQTVQWQKMNK